MQEQEWNFGEWVHFEMRKDTGWPEDRRCVKIASVSDLYTAYISSRQLHSPLDVGKDLVSEGLTLAARYLSAYGLEPGVLSSHYCIRTLNSYDSAPHEQI